ncbi:MAG TPA: LCP family protein [Gaiellaceae bacterium]|nr:LCP family protein [Gaiellaceae bacterium]
MGRAAHAANGNGNGRAEAVFPPATLTQVTRYVQPPPAKRSTLRLFGRLLAIACAILVALVVGTAAGAYLYAHQSVSDIQARSKDVKRAAAALHIPLPHQPAIALVLGYDHRAGPESHRPSLSDTLMLIRADPVTNTISLLNFPRDLIVPVYCGSGPSDKVGHVVTTGRINSAYSICGAKGSLLTIEHLTGNLPISYLITVDFHGFKEVVDKLGGVWMNVDRRYYNRNTGASYDDYANINLQPGYQNLGGGDALEFVRFRHTDDDLHRNARQQEFVQALREQISRNFSISDLFPILHAITSNIQVGKGGGTVGLGEIEKYALFAYGLPSGHLFQDRIENVTCQNTCTAPQSAIDQAVEQFTNPDVQSAKIASAAALGQKIREKTPPPASVTVTVLNGNGVAGAAANASYLLHERGYKTELPPNNVQADAPPGRTYFHSIIYYDPAQKGSRQAAVALQNLMQPADVKRLPRDPAIVARDPGSMLVVILGTAFPGMIAQPARPQAPAHHPPFVTYDASAASYLRPIQHKIPFPLEVPTVLEGSSSLDTQPGDVPMRYYWIDHRGGHKAVVLVFHSTSTNSYWDVEETNWTDAPILGDKSFRHDIGGREYDEYWNGSHLQMIVLRAHGATYWVENSLLNQLSNETMIAIAKGLKPLSAVK